jgi:hypothetical protein
MKKLTIFFLMILSINSFAKNNIDFICESKKDTKKNETKLSIEGEFKIGQFESSLSNQVASVNATLEIKAMLNGNNLYSDTVHLDASFIKATDDEVAFDEKITGKSKKIDFEFLPLNKKSASLSIKIKDVTHGFEHLDCKLN